jgi:hypothetical protein
MKLACWGIPGQRPLARVQGFYPCLVYAGFNRISTPLAAPMEGAAPSAPWEFFQHPKPASTRAKPVQIGCLPVEYLNHEFTE